MTNTKDVDDSDETALREEAEKYLYAFKTAQLPVIDRFLLAVIDRHPVKGSDREKRLLDAKHALLGAEKRGRGRIDDTGLMIEMARRLAEIQGDEDANEAVSIRELASEVAKLNPGQSAKSTADRIRKKFEGLCLRKRGNFRSKERQLSEHAYGFILMDELGVQTHDTWEENDIDDLLYALNIKRNYPVTCSTEY